MFDRVPESLPKGVAALYAINFPNGKRYIGIAAHPDKRWRTHKARAKNGSELPVHRAMRAHGGEFQMLVLGPRGYILETEIAAIKAFRTCQPQFGYNIGTGGEQNPMHMPGIAAAVGQKLRGRKMPDAVKAKIRAAWTPETRAILSAVHKGKTISAEHRERARAAQVGRKIPPEALENRRLARLRKGK